MANPVRQQHTSEAILCGLAKPEPVIIDLQNPDPGLRDYLKKLIETLNRSGDVPGVGSLRIFCKELALQLVKPFRKEDLDEWLKKIRQAELQVDVIFECYMPDVVVENGSN